MNYQRIRGWDWCEIAQYMYPERDLDDDDEKCQVAMNILFELSMKYAAYNTSKGNKEFIKKDLGPEGVNKAKKFIKVCRKFLGKLSTCNRYCSPMWEGLCKVKDDWTFLGFFRDLYKSAWS